MEINVCKSRKTVEIWLSKAESVPGLKTLCAQCRERGYLAVVYRSGTEDLADLTAGLLLYNRKALAERSS